MGKEEKGKRRNWVCFSVSSPSLHSARLHSLECEHDSGSVLATVKNKHLRTATVTVGGRVVSGGKFAF